MVYQRDARGLITQKTDGRGVVTGFAYDNAGRVTARSHPASTAENAAFTYDDATAGNRGVGRLTGFSDQSGSTAYTYDDQGRITAARQTIGSRTYTVGYAYDAAGRIASLTYPSGRVVSVGRYASGRVQWVGTQAPGASGLADVATGIGWQPFGPVQSLTYGNGLTLWKTFTQDGDLDVLLVQDTTVSPNVDLINRAHTRTDGLNLTNVWDNVDSGKNQSYWYSAANRLQNADGPWGSLTYYYDGVGNRTWRYLTQSGTTTQQQFGYPSGSNRLSGVWQGASQVRSLTHDAAGNVVSDARGGTLYEYAYDADGRLAQAKLNGTVVGSYLYDALNHRASRTAQGSSTHYVHDLSGRLLAELDGGTGATLREYVWLEDELLAMVDASGASPVTYYAHLDHIGRPIMLTDANRAVAWQAVWQPSGEVQQITGTAALTLGYPGQWLEPETGLFNNWNRHYDPTTGRYVQPDPIGLAGGINVYRYASADPLGLIDPLGLADGHHFVPQSLWRDEPLPPETRDVFNKATTGPIPGNHYCDSAHREYNQTVREMYENWKAKNNIQCETMTPQQAQDFVRQVRTSYDPRIRSYNFAIFRRIVNGIGRSTIPGWRNNE